VANVKLGLIPWSIKVNVVPPRAFDLYDEHTAVVVVVGTIAYYNDLTTFRSTW
jgi:hypothetical protein